jgi:cystathionine gamma-lyase
MMRPATRVVRAGFPKPEQGHPFMPGPVLAAPFHASGDPADSPYTYGRLNNPTWHLFEQALGELEGGAVVTFASGMAAVTAVFGAVLRPGDTILLPSDSYYTSRLVAQGYFSQMGVLTRLAPTTGDELSAALQNVKLLWLESPTNPGLDVCDIRRLCEKAHQAGVLVAVDNTTATVLGQQPLSLGADFSVASDTKSLTGHSDLILGHVAAADTNWADRLRTWRSQMGAIPGPFEVWLAHRSLGTLHVRLERQCGNALAAAQFLSARPEVLAVRYPGLATDPANEVAQSQMDFFGPVVSFVLDSRAAAEKFLAKSQLVTEATSFGGLHTTAERRARWGGDAISEGFIRLSAGCESPTDLLEDLIQAISD